MNILFSILRALGLSAFSKEIYLWLIKTWPKIADIVAEVEFVADLVDWIGGDVDVTIDPGQSKPVDDVIPAGFCTCNDSKNQYVSKGPQAKP